MENNNQEIFLACETGKLENVMKAIKKYYQPNSFWSRCLKPICIRWCIFEKNKIFWDNCLIHACATVTNQKDALKVVKYAIKKGVTKQGFHYGLQNAFLYKNGYIIDYLLPLLNDKSNKCQYPFFPNYLTNFFYSACLSGDLKNVQMLYHLTETNHDESMSVLEFRKHLVEQSFYAACKSTNLELVKWMANYATKRNINFGLLSACQSNSTIIVKYLLEQFFLTREDIYSGCMFYACQNNNLAIVKLLLQRGCIQSFDGLFGACIGGHINLVRLMVWYDGYYSYSPFPSAKTQQNLLNAGYKTCKALFNYFAFIHKRKQTQLQLTYMVKRWLDKRLVKSLFFKLISF